MRIITEFTVKCGNCQSTGYVKDDLIRFDVIDETLEVLFVCEKCNHEYRYVYKHIKTVSDHTNSIDFRIDGTKHITPPEVQDER